jgi:hypothetical protein
MANAAPRISPRLLAAIDDAARRDATVADICRTIGAEAQRLGLPRPSYEQVRRYVHASRRRRRLKPSAAQLALEVAYRAKPYDAVLERLAGTD